MKKSKNKKGFTLVELLVAISIMGIITVMALPTIGSLAERNKIKRYQNYAKTLESSGKLYTDSNNIDMFGYEGQGCYDITFEQLENKKLAKDIDFKDITCADKSSKRTFVRVKKFQDEYEYQVSMVCLNSKNSVEYEALINNSEAICSEKTSHEAPTITITPKEQTKAGKEEDSKVTIKVEDLDGLLENTTIEYAWSTNKDTNNGTYKNLNYKNERNVKKTSRKVTIPHDGKIYYLFVKPVSVRDVFNNQNIDTQVSGPYQFDIYPPSCSTVTGGSKTWTNKKRTVSVACIDKESGCKKATFEQEFDANMTTGKIVIEDNAGNKTTCTVDVYIDKDSPTCGSIKGNESWTNQNKNLSVGCTDTGGSGCTQTTFSNTFTSGSSGSITIKDNAGNTNSCSVTPKIDKSKPTCGSISGNDSWTNKSKTLSVGCTDTGGSGCEKTTFSNTFTNGNAGNITIKDNAGNTNNCSVTPKIDTTKPTCGTVSGNSNWIKTSRTITIKCTDNASGCTNNSFSQTFSTGPTGTITIKDNAGNTNDCSVQTKIDTVGPKCGTITGNDSWGKSGKSISISCTDPDGSGCEKTTFSKSFSSSAQGTITIKDKVGNTTNCTVNPKVDDKKPTCGTITGNDTWTNQNRTISVGCSDGESGCAQTTFSNTFYSSAAGTITIKDNAGNTNSCSVTPKIDKTAPTCGSVVGAGSSSSWASSRSITLYCSDSGGSGCSQSSYSLVYNANGGPGAPLTAYSQLYGLWHTAYGIPANWLAEEYGYSISTYSAPIKDNAGNTTNCPVGVYVDNVRPRVYGVASAVGSGHFNQVQYEKSSTDTKIGTSICTTSGANVNCNATRPSGYSAVRFYYINIDVGSGIAYDYVTSYNIAGKLICNNKKETYVSGGDFSPDCIYGVAKNFKLILEDRLGNKSGTLSLVIK